MINVTVFNVPFDKDVGWPWDVGCGGLCLRVRREDDIRMSDPRSHRTALWCFHSLLALMFEGQGTDSLALSLAAPTALARDGIMPGRKTISPYHGIRRAAALRAGTLESR